MLVVWTRVLYVLPRALHKLWPVSLKSIAKISTVAKLALPSTLIRHYCFALLLFKAIANTVQGFNDIKIILDYFEFFAEPFAVAVDGAVINVDLVIIGCIHQGIAAFHHAWAQGQGLQDEKFGDG